MRSPYVSTSTKCDTGELTLVNHSKAIRCVTFSGDLVTTPGMLQLNFGWKLFISIVSPLKLLQWHDEDLILPETPDSSRSGIRDDTTT